MKIRKNQIKLIIEKALRESNSDDLKKSSAGTPAARRRQAEKSSKYMNIAKENSETFRALFSSGTEPPPGRPYGFIKQYIQHNIDYDDAVSEFEKDNPEDGKIKREQLQKLRDEDFKAIGNAGISKFTGYVEEMNLSDKLIRKVYGFIQPFLGDDHFAEREKIRDIELNLRDKTNRPIQPHKNATQFVSQLSPEDQKNLELLRTEYAKHLESLKTRDAKKEFLTNKKEFLTKLVRKLKLPAWIAGVNENTLCVDSLLSSNFYRYVNTPEIFMENYSLSEDDLDYSYNKSEQQMNKNKTRDDHMQMGPSKTGVFDAPHEEHPGYMLLGNLKRLASKSEDLAKLASPWDDAEPWIESKINSAAEHIDAVHDYIMYSVLKKDFDAAEHEEMMHECGEMPGELMMEPMETYGHMEPDMIGGRHFGDGGSAQMARGQLFQIAKKSQSLSDRLVDDDTLPEWMQSKVAMAYQSISAIYDYLDYKMMRQDSGDPVLETRKRRRSR